MSLLQALVTALLSGLFSGLFLFGLNERRERHTDRLKKAEDAGRALAAWAEQLVSNYYRVFALARARSPDLHQWMNEDRALMRESNRLDDEARLLFNIYFPHLEHAHQGVREASRPLPDLLKRVYDNLLAKRPADNALIEAMSVSMTEIVKAKNVGLEILAKDAREIANRPFAVPSRAELKNSALKLVRSNRDHK